MGHSAYDAHKAPDWQHGDSEVQDELTHVTTGPVAFDYVEAANNEPLGDFTRRVYGANTFARRELIRANNPLPLKGQILVPR